MHFPHFSKIVSMRLEPGCSSNQPNVVSVSGVCNSPTAPDRRQCDSSAVYESGHARLTLTALPFGPLGVMGRRQKFMNGSNSLEADYFPHTGTHPLCACLPAEYLR